MKIGLKAGLTGTNVERWQRTLISAGHEIARDEIERRKFGPSTLAALQALQSGHGLRRTKQINRATLEILLEVEQKKKVGSDLKHSTFVIVSRKQALKSETRGFPTQVDRIARGLCSPPTHTCERLWPMGGVDGGLSQAVYRDGHAGDQGSVLGVRTVN